MIIIELPHALMLMQCFIRVISQFQEQKLLLPIEKVLPLVLPRNMINITTPCYPIYFLLSVKWLLTGG